MKRQCLSLGVAIMVISLMSACATYQPVPAFTPETITVGQQNLKADNVIFILDASSSMADGYQQWQKFDLGKAQISNMIATLPENMPVNAALRTFGHALNISRNVTLSVSDMDSFDAAELMKGLNTVSKPGGPSFLGKAIAAAAADLDGLSGNSALIIVSDGLATGDGAVAAAKRLKSEMGDSICIYTVWVGDAENGRNQMQAIADASECGMAVSGDDLSDGEKMADFMTAVFVGEQVDSDGDGVPDALDKCPGTPMGVKVDDNGCAITILSGKDDDWVFEAITFNINKATLKSGSYDTLDQVVTAMNHNPHLKLEVQGHTDISGPRAFNVKLSQNRAKTVMNYLVKKGISADRLSAVGYGPDRPIADNATESGRNQNRRVQFCVAK